MEGQRFRAIHAWLQHLGAAALTIGLVKNSSVWLRIASAATCLSHVSCRSCLPTALCRRQLAAGGMVRSHWSPYDLILKLAFCTTTCRRWSMACKDASKGCVGWQCMPAWRRSTVKPGMMRSSTSSLACRTQVDQSPPPPILVICVRSTGTAETLPGNQPGPDDDSLSSLVTNQPACGLCTGQRCNTGPWCRTHACKAKHWSAGDNPVQNAHNGLRCIPCRHLNRRFVDAHALSRLHTMLLKLVADFPFR